MTRNCSLARDDVRAGIIRFQDQTGRLVLPDGSEIPRNVPGANMHERAIYASEQMRAQQQNAANQQQALI